VFSIGSNPAGESNAGDRFEAVLAGPAAKPAEEATCAVRAGESQPFEITKLKQ
jgi:hypothetical protein